MRREYASIAAMGAILVGSQVIAILLAPLFLTGGFQAFSNPSDVTNTAVYIVLILAFTGVILLLVRFRRQNVAKYVILASIFVTLAFILLLPLYVGLYYATGQPVDDNQLAFLANLSTLLSFLIAGGLIYLLVKFPEWYVVDAVGIVTAAGVTAILGISFAILPAILLLVALAIYDAWAVYRTKHMVTLADELTSQRLPILLVIPKQAGYSVRAHGSVARTFETQAHGGPLPTLSEETTARDRPGTAVCLHRGPAAQAVPDERREPEGPRPESGIRQRPGPPHGGDEEGQDRHSQGEPVQPELCDAEHHHARRDDSDGDRPRAGHVPSRPGRRHQRGPHRNRRELSDLTRRTL